jgi:SAM-dependent methyltransferase
VEAPFEEIYESVGRDLNKIPWARLGPREPLVAWLDTLPPATGQPAVVVACGLGDDAEELSRRGYQVSAFDVAPTAIRLCHERFPDSPVDYRVADLFDLPPDWTRRFDLVVEVHTVQSLPPSEQPAGVRAIADLVAPDGALFVRVLIRREWEPTPTRPWPVPPEVLAGYVDAGLIVGTSVDVETSPAVAVRETVYHRPDEAPLPDRLLGLTGRPPA